MDDTRLFQQIDETWDQSIVPALERYIRIPAQSPHFDPQWIENGFVHAACELAREWVADRHIPGASVEVLSIPGRTPVLLVERPGDRPGTVLLYGHLDKQPPMTGWRDGFGPWTPVLTPEGKLYGRGASDDGYAVFASVAALEALLSQGVALPRVVLLIECSEESGSPDLPAYLDAFGDRLGVPDLVVCLDSGAGDYDRMWMTSSLRGLVGGELRVRVLENGVHSGDASGVVASSFRIARALVDRLEDAATGNIRVESLHVPIPASRMADAERVGVILGEQVWTKFPFVAGMSPVERDPVAMILARTWRPALAVTGADGLPPSATAGNVLRAETRLRLSLRLPPSLDADAAVKTLTETLTADPPYGAQVSFATEGGTGGWSAPELAPWLTNAVDTASERFFGHPSAAIGEGGSIPFMGLLGARYPRAQFLITGGLGPESNAHGPNEFLHIPYAKRLTACVAHVIAAIPG